MRMKLKSKKKKKKKYKILKVLVLLLISYFSFEYMTYSVLKSKLATSNEEFLNHMLRDSNHYLLYQKSEENVISKIGKYFMDFDLQNPISLLNIGKDENKTEVVYQEQNHNATFIRNSETLKEPKVYIYNTHQNENYSMKTLEPYNITPNVMMASYLMKENFKKNGVEAIVEETDFQKYLKEHQLNHAQSYQASREFVTQILKKYPTLKLIIDLHRDAIPKSSSTITLNQKNYAKILFIVGLNNQNYQKNLDLATNLSNQINDAYSKLSRGIMKKTGATVNGLYNQDLNSNMILLELGANENTIDEIQNTVEAITPILSKYINS